MKHTLNDKLNNKYEQFMIMKSHDFVFTVLTLHI